MPQLVVVVGGSNNEELEFRISNIMLHITDALTQQTKL